MDDFGAPMMVLTTVDSKGLSAQVVLSKRGEVWRGAHQWWQGGKAGCRRVQSSVQWDLTGGSRSDLLPSSASVSARLAYHTHDLRLIFENALLLYHPFDNNTALISLLDSRTLCPSFSSKYCLQPLVIVTTDYYSCRYDRFGGGHRRIKI